MRIELEDDGAELGKLRPGLLVAVRVDGRHDGAVRGGAAMNAAAQAIAGDVGTTVAIPAPPAADSTRRRALGQANSSFASRQSGTQALSRVRRKFAFRPIFRGDLLQDERPHPRLVRSHLLSDQIDFDPSACPELVFGRSPVDMAHGSTGKVSRGFVVQTAEGAFNSVG